MGYRLETEKIWQYDQGIRIIIPSEYLNCIVQFYSKEYPDGLAVNEYTVEEDITYCNIPNQMLMYDSVITAYAYRLETKRQITESCTKIYVSSRQKPPDYVLDPTDVITYKTAEELISKLKKYENVSADAKSGEDVSASVTVTENSLVFHFVIPPGPQGPKGDTGETGPQGETGADGNDGYTPVKGTDYWTEEDIQDIRNYIDTMLGVIENGSY